MLGLASKSQRARRLWSSSGPSGPACLPYHHSTHHHYTHHAYTRHDLAWLRSCQAEVLAVYGRAAHHGRGRALEPLGYRCHTAELGTDTAAADHRKLPQAPRRAARQLGVEDLQRQRHLHLVRRGAGRVHGTRMHMHGTRMHMHGVHCMCIACASHVYCMCTVWHMHGICMAHARHMHVCIACPLSSRATRCRAAYPMPTLHAGCMHSTPYTHVHLACTVYHAPMFTLHAQYTLHP